MDEQNTNPITMGALARGAVLEFWMMANDARYVALDVNEETGQLVCTYVGKGKRAGKSGHMPEVKPGYSRLLTSDPKTGMGLDMGEL